MIIFHSPTETNMYFKRHNIGSTPSRRFEPEQSKLKSANVRENRTFARNWIKPGEKRPRTNTKLTNFNDRRYGRCPGVFLIFSSAFGPRPARVRLIAISRPLWPSEKKMDINISSCVISYEMFCRRLTRVEDFRIVRRLHVIKKELSKSPFHFSLRRRKNVFVPTRTFQTRNSLRFKSFTQYSRVFFLRVCLQSIFSVKLLHY